MSKSIQMHIKTFVSKENMGYPSKNKKCCSVPNCIVNDNDKLSFHLLPQDEVLRSKWVEVLRLTRPSRSTRICARHFTKNDFFFPSIETKRHKLKRGVVPSQNLPEPPEIKKIEKINKTLRQTRQMNNTILLRPITKANILSITSTISRHTECAEKENDTILPKYTKMEYIEDLQNNKNIHNGGSISKSTVIDKQTQTRETSFQKAKCRIFIDTEIQLYEFTGLRNFSVLTQIVKRLEKSQNLQSNNKTEISVKDRVLLTLIKLKLNLSFICLSAIFEESAYSCENHFISTIALLRIHLSDLIKWPDKEEVLKNMPVCFLKYTNTRVILERIEVIIEKPKCNKCRNATYSTSAANHTVQFLIGRTPFGTISFLSKAYGGRMNDKQILLKSALLDKLIPNVDYVMMDRSLLIENECQSRGIKCRKIPFLSKKVESPEHYANPSGINNIKTYVEQCVHRLKIFKIMEEPISYNLVKHVDSIMIVMCALVNFNLFILPSDNVLHLK